MTTTNIQWTDECWNVLRGCSRVSAGCGDASGGGCYAERQAHRFSGPGMPYEGLVRLTTKGPRWTGEVRFVAEKLADPLRWRRPRRVFVNSMSDLFHESLSNEQIAAVFGVMAAAPQHTFQVLTKRPERMREWFGWAAKHGAGYDLLRDSMPSGLLACAWEAVSGDAWGEIDPPFDMTPDARTFGVSWPLPNVWLGISVEDQATADERIPLLLDTPAAVRWVSYEPALGPIDFDLGRCDTHDRDELAVGDYGEFCNECAADGWSGELSYGHWLDPLNGGLDWIVVGGESGPGARPFDLAWARSVIEQARGTGCAVFMKQLGANRREDGCHDPGHTASLDRVRDRKGGDQNEWPKDLRVREWPEVPNADS